jgi:single-strand DNA-binding protein
MASRSINRVVILGHLGLDAETRFTPNGVARTIFSIATDWHNVVLWRSENLAAYLTKGKQVYVEGRLATRSYDKDGERRYVTEVIAEDMILLGGNGGTKDTKSSKSAHPQRASGASVSGQRTSAGSGNTRSGSVGRTANQQWSPSPDNHGVTDDGVPSESGRAANAGASLSRRSGPLLP